MNDAQYASFVKMMASTAAVSSTASRRRGMEQQYFLFHKARGAHLRKKYRP